MHEGYADPMIVHVQYLVWKLNKHHIMTKNYIIIEIGTRKIIFWIMLLFTRCTCVGALPVWNDVFKFD